MHTLCIISTLYTHFVCTVRDTHFEHSVIPLITHNLYLREPVRKKIRDFLGVFPKCRTPPHPSYLGGLRPKKIGKKWSKFPKGGGGGGARHLGKTPKKSRILFLRGSLTFKGFTMHDCKPMYN